jgi:hypothetical protein
VRGLWFYLVRSFWRYGADSIPHKLPSNPYSTTQGSELEVFSATGEKNASLPKP